MKIPIPAFALALVAGSLFAVSHLSAHCGTCGVGDDADHADHADRAMEECPAYCEMECCEESGHALTGVVTNVMPDRRMVVVKHDEIPGVMAAMTMGFAVPESFDLATLKKGDAITARMVRDDKGFLIKFITVVPPKA